MEMSSSIDQLAKALAAAQAEMKNPPLDGRNPHFNSRFATLAAVRDAVFPVLARHGLALFQSPGSTEIGPTVTNLLMHVSGQWVRSDPLTMPATKRDAQGFGSALSYCRRYALMTIAGVVGDDDDDGEAAQPAPARKGAQPTPAAGPPPANGGPAPAPPRLARPFRGKLGDDDLATPEMLHYLRQECFRTGHTIAALRLRYGLATVTDMLVRQYENALDGFAKLPDKGQAEVPEEVAP